MATAKAYEPKMTKEEYDQMARQIVRASESLWDGDLGEANDAIELERLWPILSKHLNPQENGNKTLPSATGGRHRPDKGSHPGIRLR